MLFTSQYLDPRQQVASSACSLPCPTDVRPGSFSQPVSRLILVGSQNEQAALPGPAPEDTNGSNPRRAELAQIPHVMKNARKHPDFFVDAKAAGATGSMAPKPQTEETLNPSQTTPTTPAGPREPEAPEIESFRHFLKARLPLHKASPALSQRIRNAIQDDKKA